MIPESGGVVSPFVGREAVDLQPAWDRSPALVAVAVGPDLALVYQNRAAEAVFGRRPLGRPMLATFPELTQDDIEPLRRVLSTGVPVEAAPRRVGLLDRDGGEVFLRYVLTPLLGGSDRQPEGVVITAVDVTGEVRAEQAAGRTRVLADVADRMAAASSAASGLQELTDALVPSLADVAAVYVVSDAPRPGQPQTAPVAPQAITVTATLERHGSPPPSAARDRSTAWDESLWAGEPVILPVTPASMPELAPDAPTAAWLTAAAAHTFVILPLVVAGELTGALVLMAAGDRSPYVPGDLPFLTDVAARAGTAIGQLSSRQRQLKVALDLQRALLPVEPPEIDGLAVAARYVAGAPDVEVGGDWWDVLDLEPGRVGIGIGDVSGRGVAAAAMMGQARAGMHAAGLAPLGPAQVLRIVDGQLHEVIRSGKLSEPAAPQFATACYGVLDLSRGELCISNAGHLPLLVRRADGQTFPIWLPAAAPLGLRSGRFTETTIPLSPGDMVLLATDGLVEVRGEDLDTGVAALVDTLRRCGGEASLDRLADQILHGMSRRPGYGSDDIALVIARITD